MQTAGDATGAHARSECANCVADRRRARAYALRLEAPGGDVRDLDYRLCSECVLEILRLDCVSLRGAD